ncbi:hypothetical protein N875_00365 [Neisseria meningitidis LNP21362]|nr:hypothetical protein N875_00365 [Neisseria meningitidis LNP21362]
MPSETEIFGGMQIFRTKSLIPSANPNIMPLL